MDIKSRKWNSAYAKLTKAVRAPSTSSGTGGSCGTVSELAELAVKTQGPGNLYGTLALP